MLEMIHSPYVTALLIVLVPFLICTILMGICAFMTRRKL